MIRATVTRQPADCESKRTFIAHGTLPRRGSNRVAQQTTRGIAMNKSDRLGIDALRKKAENYLAKLFQLFAIL